MSSPISRRSILLISTMTAFRSNGFGWSICLRPNASSCRVSGVARSAATWISVDRFFARWSSSACGPAGRCTRDDGEQVVEVVSHAARQPADRFHLLRLAILLFK